MPKYIYKLENLNTFYIICINVLDNPNDNYMHIIEWNS